MYFKAVSIVVMMLASGTRGGYKAICGIDRRCVPNHECVVPYTGKCEQTWCCKLPKYTELPPPAGECICVSDEGICGKAVEPFLHLHPNGECSCCECKPQCVALLENQLCPTFESPVGNCDNELHYQCCKTNERTDPPSTECKCLKKCSKCPRSWKQVGVCRKCCLP